MQEKLLPFLKEHAVALVLGIVGLLCLGYGLVSSSKQHSADTAVQLPAASQHIIRPSLSVAPRQITVDIEGSVEKPGVYKLSSNSRIQDAFIAAGGLAQNADRQRVAQTINLAAPLTDSAKLYIPAVGEQYTGPESGSSSSSGNGDGSSTKTVNINQASSSDLDALPGVGAVTAQKIISNRPYQSVQELLDKKIVGASEFAKIKDQVSVY